MLWWAPSSEVISSKLQRDLRAREPIRHVGEILSCCWCIGGIALGLCLTFRAIVRFRNYTLLQGRCSPSDFRASPSISCKFGPTQVTHRAGAQLRSEAAMLAFLDVRKTRKGCS